MNIYGAKHSSVSKNTEAVQWKVRGGKINTGERFYVEWRNRWSQTHYIGAPKGLTLNVKTPLESWSLFFDDKILNCILIHTNEKINRKIAKMIASNVSCKSYHKHVIMLELKATTIRTIIFRGTAKGKLHQHTGVVIAFWFVHILNDDA